ncbi:MAG: hypothetical protein JST41_14360 [Bacteroidetes bacterium]|nr:hypothetical protein [Bacteroidota bacterium]HMU13430.1 hypothetical protein [Flavobacteriales bacterium]
MSALLPHPEQSRRATLLEQHQIRRLYDDATETSALLGWFSMIHTDTTAPQSQDQPLAM